jgi:hypothetical protein
LKQAAANIAIDSTPVGIANARVHNPLQFPPQPGSESRLYLYRKRDIQLVARIVYDHAFLRLWPYYYRLHCAEIP